MELARRSLSYTLRARSTFHPDPGYILKCGLEIHTQLNTRYKLFSLSPTSFDAVPNSNVSYFDCGLPGTQPRLNPEAVLLALKAAVALDAEVQTYSSFDRKHYFYPDQPSGYQITQYFHPIARGGKLKLTREADNIPGQLKIINIEQIQLEQDTGKTNLHKSDNITKIDYNRSNIPLIELITKPDFESVEHVCAFLRKYQSLMKHLGVCTGDLETGAMRVDVNVSINGYARVELKNLRSYSDIRAAIKSEYGRQIDCIKNEILIRQETRGWNGHETVPLRLKDDAVDYRFVPDSELPPLRLSPQIGDEIRATFPELPDEVLQRLSAAPYLLEKKLARFLLENPATLQYYQDLWQAVGLNETNLKTVNSWFFNNYLGSFTKLDIPIDFGILNSSQLAKLISKILNGSLSNNSAKSIVMDVLRDGSISDDRLLERIEDCNSMDVSGPSIRETCLKIVSENGEVVAKVVSGNKKPVMFLVGLVMKQTKGKFDATVIKEELEAIIYDTK